MTATPIRRLPNRWGVYYRRTRRDRWLLIGHAGSAGTAQRWLYRLIGAAAGDWRTGTAKTI